MCAQRSDATDPAKSSKPLPPAGVGVFLRLGWMVAGPLMILVSSFVVASNPRWTFGTADSVFAFGVGIALALRYWDIEIYGGQTANGEPASMIDYRRYAWGLVLVAGLAWTAAQSVYL